MISIYTTQKDLPINKASARSLVDAVLSFLEIPYEEVSIYFVNEKKISQLHDQFFEDPTPTDCISFPLDEKHLGEIFVCPAVAIRYASKRGQDPYRETALYVIHGLLHLIGYDDLEAKAKEAMRKKEKSCMRHLDRLKITLQ
ncbi:MAG: rRNA maturation RNase YbeY [Verrucomicrobia bacterium]|nr:rRNA maturation RNase YbeY [Verrucomicrobiota bacterium]MBU6446674.1 rRNA maturation RNase YbeY [Verrucomicrobiota bacterium]